MIAGLKLPRWASNSLVPMPLALGLILIAVMVAYGLVLLVSSEEGFNRYVREDGIVEWLTVVWLLLATSYAFAQSRAFSRQGDRGRLASGIWLFCMAVILFAVLRHRRDRQRKPKPKAQPMADPWEEAGKRARPYRNR